MDATIALLSQFMEVGDILIDGGNEWFPNSVRRFSELEPRGSNIAFNRHFSSSSYFDISFPLDVCR